MNKKSPAEASLLIILMGALGDVARGLAVVKPLKEAYPNCKISWLVESKWQALVVLHPDIDRVYTFEREQGVRGAWKLFRELRQSSFDITLDLQRHLKSGICSWISGAPRRIGFNRKNTKELNFLFNNEKIPYYSETCSKTAHYLLFTEHLGVTPQKSLDFGLQNLDPGQAIPELLVKINGSFIVLVMGSSWASKDWPPEGYVNLSRIILANTPHKVALLGDRSQTKVAAAVCNAVQSAMIINLVNKTALSDLPALLKSAQACVGPDSGPGHIAATVRTPYVTLFGPTLPSRTAPYGNEQLVVRSQIGCAPCYRRRCPGLNKLCMRLISAEAVWEKLRVALK